MSNTTKRPIEATGQRCKERACPHPALANGLCVRHEAVERDPGYFTSGSQLRSAEASNYRLWTNKGLAYTKWGKPKQWLQ